MKYSVIMPVYLINEAHKPVIIETVTSVIQNSSDYEFIIVNDGSELDVSFLREYADVFIDRKQNYGIARSWNDGLKLARGEYLCVINDDIVVPENWLNGIRTGFNMPNVGVSAPRVEHLPDPESGIEIRQTWFPGSCFMLNRETFKSVGYFDERFLPFNCEDVDYWKRILNKGYQMARVYDVYVEHKEGNVLHTLNYTAVNNKNVQKLIEKWGYDIREEFYK